MFLVKSRPLICFVFSFLLIFSNRSPISSFVSGTMFVQWIVVVVDDEERAWLAPGPPAEGPTAPAAPAGTSHSLQQPKHPGRSGR